VTETDKNNEKNVDNDVGNTLLKTKALPALITKLQNGNDTNPPLMSLDVPFIEKEENNTDTKIFSTNEGSIIANDVQHEEDIDYSASSDVATTEKVLTSDVKSVDVKPFICSIISDHKFQFLQEKTQSAWCKPRARFHGVQCQGCPKIFIHDKGDDDVTYKPSIKRPLWSCPNEKHKCTYAICEDCRLKESIKNNKLSKQVINKEEELYNDMEVTKEE
jgi:hypothetical protein